MSAARNRKTQGGGVAFVGAGPGDERLLTLRAVELLGEAEVVAVDAAGESALKHCRPDVEIVDLAGVDAAERGRRLVALGRSGRRVVRLVPGDPGLSAAAVEETDAVAKAKLGFELVPGVSGALAVPLYAGVPLASRRAHDVQVVDVGPDAGEPDWSSLTGAGTLVLLGGGGAVGKAAAALIEHGRPGSTPVAVTADGTRTTQRTVVSTLDAVEGDVAAAGLDPSAVVVIGETVRMRERLSWFETKPLFGWTVLVPRTKEQSAALTEQLRAYGAVPVEVPTIAVEPPRSPAAMDRAIKGLVSGRYAWVAFTSTNAVRAVREKLEELGLDARALGGVKVAAVGEVTAEALRGWGIRPDLTPSGEQSSEGLLADWPEHDELLDLLDHVFLPRADIATETLAAGLVERGWQVDDVTAYRTVRAAPPPADTREAIKTGGFDAVLFTSSSTVRNLVGIAGKPHPSTVIACIGPQTCVAAEEHGLKVEVTAPTPSAAALAEALAEYGRARREAGETGLPGKANRARSAAARKR